MGGDELELPPGYELVRRLGAGAFGEVFLAYQPAIGRKVAAKRILRQALADPANVERFRREARVLAATDCASVVKVYDLHTGDHGALLVMEYVPGQTLSDLVARGRMPADDALRALQDVAEALRHMADHGVVHRDVKPGNVFVLPDGHAKLGDFGLARALVDESAFKTAGGSPRGTPAYFPPEVSQGTSPADRRSDAYSFAVMAYEVLTGRRPFEAPDALALIIAHWEREPVPPGEALPGIPEAASNALLAGLDKEPACRPLPHELVERLNRIPLEDWPVSEPRPVAVAAGRSDPTLVRPGVTPPPVRQAPPPVPRRRRRLPRHALIVGLGVTGAVVAAFLVVPRLGGDGQLTVESVDLEVVPTEGACPQAAYVFSAAIATNGSPGTLRFRWVRPDGVRTDERQVALSSGQSSVTARLEFTMRGRTPMVGEAVLMVLSPGTTTASKGMTYRCENP